MPKCDRCKKDCYATIMSMFNTEMICFMCELKERDHPKYKEAVKKDCDEIRNGNYNFKGIGL